MDENDYMDNNINFSVNFKYPDDEEDRRSMEILSLNEFINKFAVYLISSKDSKQCLCAILYATNYDIGILLNTENTIASISKSLGLSKQNFSSLVKQVSKELNITTTNTGMLSEAKKCYRTTNYRKVKNNERLATKNR